MKLRFRIFSDIWDKIDEFSSFLVIVCIVSHQPSILFVKVIVTTTMMMLMTIIMMVTMVMMMTATTTTMMTRAIAVS